MTAVSELRSGFNCKQWIQLAKQKNRERPQNKHTLIIYKQQNVFVPQVPQFKLKKTFFYFDWWPKILGIFDHVSLINPSTPRSDKHVTSPYSIHTLFSKQVMRILKLIRYKVLP